MTNDLIEENYQHIQSVLTIELDGCKQDMLNDLNNLQTEMNTRFAGSKKTMYQKLSGLKINVGRLNEPGNMFFEI